MWSFLLTGGKYVYAGIQAILKYPTARYATLGIAVGLAGWWGLRQHRERLADARADARSALLYADSLRAANDTTRLVAQLRGDSLRVYARRAIQSEQRADALDQTLGVERRLRSELTFTITRLEAQAQTLAEAMGADTLAGDFHIRQEPYTVQARAVLVRPPTPSRLTVSVQVDTIPVEVRVGCGPAGAGGVRPATASVQVPAWAPVGLRSVAQAPEVCAPAPAPTGGGVRPAQVGLGLLLGLALGSILGL